MNNMFQITFIFILDVNSYHVDTGFLLLESTIDSGHQLCNATYSEKKVTRQLATRSNITGSFTILCYISDNQRTTNDKPLQTCVDVFTDIDIEFSCYSFYDFITGKLFNTFVNNC